MRTDFIAAMLMLLTNIVTAQAGSLDVSRDDVITALLMSNSGLIEREDFEELTDDKGMPLVRTDLEKIKNGVPVTGRPAQGFAAKAPQQTIDNGTNGFVYTPFPYDLSQLVPSLSLFSLVLSSCFRRNGGAGMGMMYRRRDMSQIKCAIFYIYFDKIGKLYQYYLVLFLFYEY